MIVGNFRRGILGISVLLASTLALTGCVRGIQDLSCDSRIGKPSLSIEREVAVVLAPTSNFINIENVLAETQAQILELLNFDGTQFSIILADGTPSVVSKQWIDFSGSAFETDRIEIVNRAKNNLSWAVACATGKNENSFITDPEVDLLRSIQVASETFSDSDAEKFIYVLSNGIQTSGQLDMQKGLPADALASEKLVTQLTEAGALGNLKGATVHWSGLGQLNEREKQPNLQSIESLVSLWTGVILMAGGKVASISPGSIPGGMPPTGSIPVASIPWLADACVSVTIGRDRGFEFEEDLAEFLDLAAAQEGAKIVADEINNSSCSGVVTVTGYTASGGPQANYKSSVPRLQSLSLARAEAFAQLLRDAGVEGKIDVIGAGKGPVNDWDEDGNLVEELAAQNRKVVVVQN